MQEGQSRQDKGLEQCRGADRLPQLPRTGRAMDGFTAPGNGQRNCISADLTLTFPGHGLERGKVPLSHLREWPNLRPMRGAPTPGSPQ